jgi:pimeloyl-ACP methyl ester carboxylesterase
MAGCLVDHYTVVTYDRRGYVRSPLGDRASRQTWPYQSSVALADHLGTPLVEFPGDHAGFSNHSKQFAGRLYGILSR